jgi:NADH dehydrogenase
MNEYNLKTYLRDIAVSCGCEFIKEEVKGIDFDEKRIYFKESGLDYRYLIIASGSETNFFGQDRIKEHCLKIDSIADAVHSRESIVQRSEADSNINIVISGGGYTGVEIATNIDFLLKKKDTNHHITVVEKSDEILSALPAWLKERVCNELKTLGIEIITADSIKEYNGSEVILRSGGKISNSICIWTAGVKTASFIESINAEKQNTRINASLELKIKNSSYDNVYVAGDVCSFLDKDDKKPLRMAAMFSMGQGKVAAQNIINSILDKPLVKYRPIDLGYLVPMAHGKAYGAVLGTNIEGYAGYVMHYLMCVYRSGMNNRKGIIRNIFRKMKN